jgi:hypothetical protein
MQPRLGFVSTAAAPVLLGFGPVGWVMLGAATVLPFLRFGSPRGNYQLFDAEVYPTLASLSKYTALDTITGWHEELVGVDAAGNRKVYGSWVGEGPSWGDKAAAKIMELAQDNFIWSYQPNRSDGPWVLVGPHPVLGSVVYDVFYAIQSAIEYWDRERERFNREYDAANPPTEPIPVTEYPPEPIKPEDITPPPETAPPIDPPAPPPPVQMPAPRPPGGIFGRGGIFGPGGILSKIPSILGGIFGGGGNGRRYPPGTYPPGTYPPGTRAPGAPGAMTNDDWLLIGAAGLLFAAAMTGKKKAKKHAAATK